MTSNLEVAKRVLGAGGLVVYATDTLWGLAANAADPAAARRVFEAKRRPLDMPLSIGVAQVADVAHWAHVSPVAQRLWAHTTQGLTLILEAKARLPRIVTGGGDSVGVRVFSGGHAHALASSVGAVTATSANTHGRADPVTLDEARSQLGNRVDYYLASSSAPSGAASTLVDARSDEPIILRKGSVSEARIRQILA